MLQPSQAVPDTVRTSHFTSPSYMTHTLSSHYQKVLFLLQHKVLFK